MIKRSFIAMDQVQAMIKGYKLLFGCEPKLSLTAENNRGGMWTGYLNTSRSTSLNCGFGTERYPIEKITGTGFRVFCDPDQPSAMAWVRIADQADDCDLYLIFE